jgi:hypothetical protein
MTPINNQPPKSKQFKHIRYFPHNPNLLHKAEQNGGGLNTRIAVTLTTHVGSMWAAYLFVGIAVVGLAAIFGLLPAVAVLLVVWISQTFLQLFLLPVIMVGQNVLDRKSQLQAEETYNTAVSSYKDLEQIMQKLHDIEAKLEDKA